MNGVCEAHYRSDFIKFANPAFKILTNGDCFIFFTHLRSYP